MSNMMDCMMLTRVTRAATAGARARATSTHYLGVHEPAGGAAARARIIIQIQRSIPRLECPAARDDGGAPLGWHDRGRGGDLGAAENASEYMRACPERCAAGAG